MVGMFALAGAATALTPIFAQELNLTENQSAVQAKVTNAPIGGNMTGNISANVTPS
jgi:hypothetical protein